LKNLEKNNQLDDNNILEFCKILSTRFLKVDGKIIIRESNEHASIIADGNGVSFNRGLWHAQYEVNKFCLMICNSINMNNGRVLNFEANSFFGNTIKKFYDIYTSYLDVIKIHNDIVSLEKSIWMNYEKSFKEDKEGGEKKLDTAELKDDPIPYTIEKENESKIFDLLMYSKSSIKDFIEETKMPIIFTLKKKIGDNTSQDTCGNSCPIVSNEERGDIKGVGYAVEDLENMLKDRADNIFFKCNGVLMCNGDRSMRDIETNFPYFALSYNEHGGKILIPEKEILITQDNTIIFEEKNITEFVKFLETLN
jgi:hypothetical protein